VLHCQRLYLVAACNLGWCAYEHSLFQVPLGSDSVWVYGGPSSPPASLLSRSTDVQPGSESTISLFTAAIPSSVSAVPCTAFLSSSSTLTTPPYNCLHPAFSTSFSLVFRLTIAYIVNTDQQCVIVPRPSCRCHYRVCWFHRRLAPYYSLSSSSSCVEGNATKSPIAVSPSMGQSYRCGKMSTKVTMIKMPTSGQLRSPDYASSKQWGRT